MPGSVQDGFVPDPVKILIKEARGSRPLRIEPLECAHVDETEREFPLRWRQAGLQQPIEHDGTGDLIAMHKREQSDVRPREF